MRVIHCEQCGTPLPWTAQFCAICGAAVSLHPLISDYPDASGQNKKRPRTGSLKTYSFYKMGQSDPDETQRINHTLVRANSTPLPTLPARDDAPGSQAFIEDWSEDEGMDDQTSRRATWQKFVTRKTSAVPTGTPNAATPVTPPYRVRAGLAPALGNGLAPALENSIAPAPGNGLPLATPITPIPPTSPPYRVRAGLAPALGNGLPPALENSVPPLISPHYKKQPPRSPLMPRVAGWIAIAVIVALLLGGGFGVFISLGRNASSGPSTNSISLQVTPSSIALGGTVTLRGSHFTPRGRVGLTRDASIPITDTGGSSTTTADASGSFSDTVSIDESWTSGQHTIYAEDAHLHKTASFSVLVTGHSISLRPAHLALSVASLDLGSGDQATNSAQTITLFNAGGGEIDWQSTVTQPWLMLSPKSGAIAVGQQMQVTLAADRSSLQIGSYTASVIFASNTGSITLPVKMQVTQLQPGHAPVMQVTPAVLSFSGVDGGASPGSQPVTISNPGVLPLQWNAASVTNDGSNWLSAFPQSGIVAKGSAQSVTISVNSGQLLPGVYYGSVTFSSQGSPVAVNNPQTIYVSITIVPQCAIQVSPGSLSFTGVYLQPAPLAKSISIGVSQGCSPALNWTASATTVTGGRWLSLSAIAGTTPSSPIVGVNVTGLKPGTYSGSLVFSSAAGTQTLPVTLLLGPATTPIITAAPALLTVNGVVGQITPSIQSIVLSNTGGGTLLWSAVATTTVGGAWLSVTPATGVLASQKSTTLTVTVTVLKTLIPGTYTGSVTITGKDSTGHIAAGSPQTLPITFTVKAPCSLSTPLPALTFQSVLGQAAPLPQQITLTAAGACANALNWSAAVATVPAGGTWLTATPATGTVSAAVPSLTMAGIVNTGLLAGTYTGHITISATDSVTHLAVGLPQVVTVTLTVLPGCTLQAPSVASEVFSSQPGLNPAAQTFTIGVAGACTGSVTITPTASMTNGAGWLAVTPASTTVAANGIATITVTVTSAALAAGSYAGKISLAAVNSLGVAITGSPQAVGVTLTVASPPALSVAPASLTFNITPGPSSQTITIKNTGGSSLNWSAALASGAPAYVTITPLASGSLAAGASAILTISVNGTGLPSGTTASTSVTISAVDPATGGVVAGSPASVAINVTITAPPPPPPAMQLSATALAFTTTVGANPAAQTITITNTGGGTLTWTAGTPSQPWLTVTPSSGSDTAGGTSTPSFSVTVGSMVAGKYTATVNITAPGGISQTVTVTLTIN